MLIFDEPYISELALKTAQKNNFSILKTKFVESFPDSNSLSLLSSLEAVSELKKQENPLVYTNSENSINWICNNLKFTKLPEYINLFKDKNKFRQVLKSIYPDFFFKEFPYSSLKTLDVSNYKFPFIIKPTIGFLSMGVYLVKSLNEWNNILNSLADDMEKCKDAFPLEVMDSSNFIIEQYIDGDEFAVDAYFDKNSNPTILNIFQHPFINESDVSDRAYLTSKVIIKDNLSRFEKLLSQIGELTSLKNFPMHIEVRVSKDGLIIPIEVNPLRFAGWHTTDLAYYAYGINVYEYFMCQKKPDWNKLLESKGDEIYYFMMAEVPSDVDRSEVLDFKYEELKKSFSKTLEFRKIDWRTKPLFAMSFGQINDKAEINHILNFDVKDYIVKKEVPLCK